MIQFWLVWKYLFSGRKFFNATSFFAVFGVALGVACLVVSMSVVSGFETTLKRAVIDLTGHVNLIKRGSTIGENEKVIAQLAEALPSYVAHTPFVRGEAVVAHDQVISGVVLEGVDPVGVAKVLRIKDRLIEGEFDLTSSGDTAHAVIGKGVKKRFGLEIGDVFQVILPVPSGNGGGVFSPKVKTFKVTGVLSLGKYDYDERFVVTDIRTVQSLAGIPGEFTGLKIMIEDDEAAPLASDMLNAKLGYPYMARHWIETNANLLSAVKNEKWVIFFVVLIMVVAACFNVCSHLFVSVLRRYGDISILKTLGAGTWFIAGMFTLHGLIMGTLGALLGVGLGAVLSYVFVWVQSVWEIMPGEVYKLGAIDVEMRFGDMSVVVLASIAVCFLATIAPAIRGARLNPVEGLRYE